MSPIYGAVEKSLMASSVNGAFFMEPENRDIYMDVLEPEDKPTYRAWKEHLRSRRTRKPGGALVAQRAEIEKRIFDPTDATDLETDEECAEILKVLSVNFLAGLYTSKAADYLASKLGTYSVPKITPAMKERMTGFLRTNDKGGESPISNLSTFTRCSQILVGWLPTRSPQLARITRLRSQRRVRARAAHTSREKPRHASPRRSTRRLLRSADRAPLRRMHSCVSPDKIVLRRRETSSARSRFSSKDGKRSQRRQSRRGSTRSS